MKVIVIYRSLSGFTKKYAGWIAQDLEADLFEAGQIKSGRLEEYDVIVFGGSLHAVGINGIGIIKDNLSEISDKEVVVFAVGASPPRENILDEIKSKNFSVEEQNRIRFFYLRGGFDYDKLDFFNKFLMNMLRIRLWFKRNKTPDEMGMAKAYSKPVDFARKENIKPIVEYVKTLLDLK